MNDDEQAEILGRLDALGGQLDEVTAATRALTTKTEERTATTRRAILMLWVVLVVTIVGFGGGAWRYENTRNAQRHDSRCTIRAGYVKIANAAHADPKLTVEAIRDYDADFGTSGCASIGLCRDGHYTQAVGRRGACSGHGGVVRILIKPGS